MWLWEIRVGTVRQGWGKAQVWSAKKVISWRQWDCIASAVGSPANHPECLWDCLLGGAGCGALIRWICFPLTEGCPEAVWLFASHFGCCPGVKRDLQPIWERALGQQAGWLWHPSRRALLGPGESESQVTGLSSYKWIQSGVWLEWYPGPQSCLLELHDGLRIWDRRHCCGLKFWSGALHNIRLGKLFWELIAINSFVQGPTFDCITTLWAIPGRYYSPDSFFFLIVVRCR